MFFIKPVALKKVVIILGGTGTGKSSLINMLYNNSSAETDMTHPCIVGGSSMSVTKKAQWHFKDETCYADTVGFGDPELSDFQLASDLKGFIKATESGVSCIIITMRDGRFTKEERCNLSLIKEVFEEGWKKQCMIVVTHYNGPVSKDSDIVDDEIKEERLKSWLANDDELQEFVASIGKNVIFTNNGIDNRRFEEISRPLRAQCLSKMKTFIDGCDLWIKPSPKSIYDTILNFLEKIFSFYRLQRTKERALNVIKYLGSSSEALGGHCSICIEDICFSDLAQTECHHAFHLECLKRHAEANGSTCPMCRAEILGVSTPIRASPQ